MAKTKEPRSGERKMGSSKQLQAQVNVHMEPPPTSLVKQLQQIKNPEITFGTGHGKHAGKQRPSFLFDWHQAADYDIDAIYLIGCNGLMELVRFNRTFIEFETTLFGVKLKSVDRVLRDSTFNDQLDESIGKFLALLSEYFLTNAAGKALEWLIRRFRVNEFNIEQILQCILPYHETQLFYKMLMTLQIDGSSRWSFLNEVKKTEAPMSRFYFLHRLYTDRSLLNFICSSVSDNITRGIWFSSAFTFYTATLVNYLNGTDIISEDTVTVLLPYILNGIRSHVKEWQLCNLVLISQIALRVSLQSTALISILELLAQYISVDAERELLISLISLSQSQENWPKTMPTKMTTRFLTSSILPSEMASLSCSYACDNLLTSLVHSAVMLVQQTNQNEDNSHSYEHALAMLLRAPKLNLSNHLVASLIVGIMDALIGQEENSELHQDGDVIYRFSECITALQMLDPSGFDESVTALMKRYQHNALKQAQVYKLLTPLVTGTTHVIIENHNTTALLALSHPSADIRVAGIVKLASVAAENTIVDEYVQELSQALIGVLHDEDSQAVLSTLLSSSSLTSFLATSANSGFVSAIIALFYNKHITTLSLRKLIVNALMQAAISPSVQSNPEIAKGISHLLLANIFVTSRTRKFSRFVFDALHNAVLQRSLYIPLFKDSMDSIARHILPSGKSNDGKVTIAQCIKFNEAVAESLCSSVNIAQDAALFLDMIRSSEHSEDKYAHATVGFLLMTSLITKKPELAQVMMPQLVPLCISIFQHHPLIDQDIKPFTLADLVNVEHLNASHLVSVLISTLIVYLEIAVKNNSNVTVHLEADLCGDSTAIAAQIQPKLGLAITTCLQIYDALMALDHVTLYQSFIAFLIKRVLRANVVPFLCSRLMVNNQSELVLLRTLHMINAFIQSRKEDFQLLVPLLLTLLLHQDKHVRAAVLMCFTSMQTHYSEALGGNNATDASKSKSKLRLPIYLIDTFFGDRTKNIKFLQTDIVHTLLEWILKERENLLTDAHHVITFFQHSLTRTKDTSKKIVRTQESVLMNLLSYIVAFELRPFQAFMLNMLELVSNSLKFKELAEYFEKLYTMILEKGDSDSQDVVALLKTYIGSLNDQSASALVKEKSCFELLKKFLCGHTTPTLISIQLSTLTQLNTGLWDRLTLELQEELFSTVLNVVTYSEERDVVFQGKELLKVASIPVIIVARYITKLNAVLNEKERTTKRNKSENANADAFVSKLSQLVALLEFLSYKQLEDSTVLMLVSPLFENLALIASVNRQQVSMSMEYPKQLNLTVLNTLINRAHEQHRVVDETTLRIETLVQCIRSTDNPQTHNATLLLLSTIALPFPEKVLHNIMPVFTFMGANVLRHDDEYTFRVIERTIERIVPPLVRYNKQEYQGLHLVISCRPILKVFVDSIWHIPIHRRLRLFTVLVNTLGPQQFLCPIIALLIEKECLSGQSNHGPALSDSLVEFCLLIASEFDATTQTRMLVDLLTALSSVPNSMPLQSKQNDKDSTLATQYLLDLTDHSTVSLRATKLALATFIDELLMSRSFLKTLAAAKTVQGVEDDTRQIIEQALEYASQLNAIATASSVDTQESTLPKFAKTLLRAIYTILDKVHNLLSLPTFLRIISKIWQNGAGTVRRRALQLLHEKMVVLKPATAYQHRQVILKCMTELNEHLLLTIDTSEDASVNKQTALVCFSSILSLLATEQPDTFMPIIQTIMGSTCLQAKNKAVAASSLMSLSQAYRRLGPRMVPIVPELTKQLLKVLEQTFVSDDHINDKKQDQQSSIIALLRLSALTTLETAIRILPQFMSPYLGKIFSCIFRSQLHSSTVLNSEVILSKSTTKKSIGDGSTEQTQIVQKVNDIIQVLAELVQSRLLVPPLVNFWETAVEYGPQSTTLFLSLVSNTINSMNRDAIMTLNLQLFKFFLQAFDIRRMCITDLALNKESLQPYRWNKSNVDAVEDLIVSAFLQLVSKLNEAMFKPMYLKIYNWAIVELVEMNSSVLALPTSPGHLARLCVFYKIVGCALDQLQTVFTPYCSYALDYTVNALQVYANQNHGSKLTEQQQQLNHTLWILLIEFLRKTIIFDRAGLLTPDYLEKLIPALTSQLFTLRSPMLVSSRVDVVSEYESRMELLRNCLVQLARITANDAVWKELNMQVLMATRFNGDNDEETSGAVLHHGRHVKIAALRIIMGYYQTCGEAFLMLLPETIPFLAECMEDDDVHVEKMTQETVTEIEGHLGESLQKYFN